ADNRYRSSAPSKMLCLTVVSLRLLVLLVELLTRCRFCFAAANLQYVVEDKLLGASGTVLLHLRINVFVGEVLKPLNEGYLKLLHPHRVWLLAVHLSAVARARCIAWSANCAEWRGALQARNRRGGSDRLIIDGQLG